MARREPHVSDLHVYADDVIHHPDSDDLYLLDCRSLLASGESVADSCTVTKVSGSDTLVVGSCQAIATSQTAYNQRGESVTLTSGQGIQWVMSGGARGEVVTLAFTFQRGSRTVGFDVLVRIPKVTRE